MVVNRDAQRVALVAADGPPFRGFVDTDLSGGAYRIKPDRKNRLWIFDSAEVTSTPRFSLKIDGPDPFGLNYPESLLLTVTGGLDTPGNLDLVGSCNLIKQHYDKNNWKDALIALCSLNTVDLYDVLDELWAVAQAVAGDILINFDVGQQSNDSPSLSDVVRALESFARPPSDIYVDAFSDFDVDPVASYKADDPTNLARRQAGLGTLRFDVSYENLYPKRKIKIWADDITGETKKISEAPTYGPFNLTYPPAFTAGTTPRLYNAKLAKIQELEAQNIHYMKVAATASIDVISSGVFSSLAVSKMMTAMNTNTPAAVRPKAQKGPGRWQPDAQARANMSPEAARYEVTTCHKPSGLGYYVEDVQFDGIAGGTLLDAKFWSAEGVMVKGMKKGVFWVWRKVAEEGVRQTTVAAKYGYAVEWRVATREAIPLLEEIFRINRLPIRVVFIPPV